MQLGTKSGVFTNWGATLFSFFNANVSGDYTFRVASDNGAQLYLNGSLLVDNSGKSIKLLGLTATCMEPYFRAVHRVAECNLMR